MLTGRGRTVAVLALGLFAVGRLLGLRELHMAAAALVTLLIAAVAYVAVRRGSLVVRRSASPPRTSAGGEIRVDLAVRNVGRFGAGPILFEDRIPARLNVAARLALPALRPGTERTLAYVIRPNLRGRYELGPLEVLLTDPFGLVMRRQEISATSTVVVYPSFERVRTMPRDVQRIGTVRRSPLLGAGDEFYTLRQYREGDDLRKVHWPTSMRLNELVVRQEELLREPGAVIVLDTCAAKHRGRGSGASIEAAVSACASLGTLALSLGMPLSIATSEGFLLATRRPSEAEVLEALATLQPSAQPTLAPALGSALQRGLSGSSLVCITPGLDANELTRIRQLARTATSGAIVLILASTFADGPEDLRRGRASRAAGKAAAEVGFPVVRLREQDSFHETWEAGVRGVAVAR